MFVKPKRERLASHKSNIRKHDDDDEVSQSSEVRLLNSAGHNVCSLRGEL